MNSHEFPSLQYVERLVDRWQHEYIPFDTLMETNISLADSTAIKHFDERLFEEITKVCEFISREILKIQFRISLIQEQTAKLSLKDELSSVNESCMTILLKEPFQKVTRLLEFHQLNELFIRKLGNLSDRRMFELSGKGAPYDRDSLSFWKKCRNYQLYSSTFNPLLSSIKSLHTSCAYIYSDTHPLFNLSLAELELSYAKSKISSDYYYDPRWMRIGMGTGISLTVVSI